MVTRAMGPVLIVEDSDRDFEIIQWALKKLSINIPIVRCKDGDKALDLLYNRGEYADRIKFPRPSLVLLDLNLTMMDGHEVLATIKKDDALKTIPVIIWTTSSDPQDIEISLKEGANSYILKPMTVEKLLEAVEMLNHYWFGVVVLPDATGI